MKAQLRVRLGSVPVYAWNRGHSLFHLLSPYDSPCNLACKGPFFMFFWPQRQSCSDGLAAQAAVLTALLLFVELCDGVLLQDKGLQSKINIKLEVHPF